MKNLDQIRAKNALLAAPNIGGGKNDGKSIAKKVPTMIMENGIIGALAFAIENDGNGYSDVFNAIIAHLSDPDIAKLKQTCSLEQFITWLTSTADSARLRQITAESIAYLSYLRRFAKKEG